MDAVSVTAWVVERHAIEKLWPSGAIECRCGTRIPWEGRDLYTEHVAKATLRARTTAVRLRGDKAKILMPT